MKKKAIVAISALALCAITGCFGNKADKAAALIDAAEKNDASKVRWLIRTGADVNAKAITVIPRS